MNVRQVNESMWELGDALCDTWVALDVGCCTASILNLAAISVDRCVNIGNNRYRVRKADTVA